MKYRKLVPDNRSTKLKCHKQIGLQYLQSFAELFSAPLLSKFSTYLDGKRSYKGI